MGRLFIEQLDADQVYCCRRCAIHLVSLQSRVSKHFCGASGRAYLFDWAVNVKALREKDVEMSTGLHKIKKIQCKQCRIIIGWTYVYAYEASEKYKEGKFIIERAHIMKRKAIWKLG